MTLAPLPIRRSVTPFILPNRWSDQLGRFLYYDARARKPIACDVIGGYVPLTCGFEEPYRSRILPGLAARYATPWTVPTTSPRDPAFDPRRSWRDPVWLNVNWLLTPYVDGLAERSLVLVERSGGAEYFEPTTSEALGGEWFTWTTALALDLLART